MLQWFMDTFGGYMSKAPYSAISAAEDVLRSSPVYYYHGSLNIIQYELRCKSIEITDEELSEIIQDLRNDAGLGQNLHCQMPGWDVKKRDLEQDDEDDEEDFDEDEEEDDGTAVMDD